jgi:hypothetical protein
MKRNGKSSARVIFSTGIVLVVLSLMVIMTLTPVFKTSNNAHVTDERE